MRISDWSSDVCSSDLYVTEHPTRIGGVHCVVQPRAIARFRHARVKQWNVVARREPPIGNGAVAAKIDTDNLPNSLCRLVDAAEELHGGRYGFDGARQNHRYGFAVVEWLAGFDFRLSVTPDIRVEADGMGEIDQIFQAGRV